MNPDNRTKAAALRHAADILRGHFGSLDAIETIAELENYADTIEGL